jgi:hypothetical protein
VDTGPAIIDREGRVQIYTPERTEWELENS